MKIGIITPMEKEKRLLLQKLEDQKKVFIGGQSFVSGTIYDQEVILTESGIGKVQAAMATTILLDRYHPDFVVNTGSAGALGKGLKVGDQLIADRLAYHDVYNTIKPGSVGQLPGKELYFKSDPKLVAEFLRTSPNAHQGLVLSGDSFVMGDMKDKIIASFPDALAVEMEGTAVGQVAANFKTPFVVLRAISDAADDKADLSFDEFLEIAGQKSAEILLNFIKEQK